MEYNHGLKVYGTGSQKQLILQSIEYGIGSEIGLTGLETEYLMQ